MDDSQKPSPGRRHHADLAHEILTQILNTGQCQIDSSTLPHAISEARWRQIARAVGDGLGCLIVTACDRGVLRACVPSQPTVAAEYLARDHVATEPVVIASTTRKTRALSQYR